MKSRIGFSPNGSLLFKNPEQHFNEEDFINAIDSWSKSIKDNPVANFAAKIKIKQIHVFPIFHLMSHRKYENRSLKSYKKVGNPRQYNRVPAVSWAQVNAWNYDLAEEKNNHEVTLTDTIYSEDCSHCHTTGVINIRCTGCSGRGHTVEEEYSNGNTYRVTKSCFSCGGTGEKTKECPTCDGQGGFIHYLNCLVEYDYPSLSKTYAEDRVSPISNDLPWEEKDFNYFDQVKSAAEFVAFVAGDIKELSTGHIIHFINSHDSNNQKLVREVTTYGYTYASYVNFDYEEGGEYTLLLFGDKNKVFAPDSPVANSIDNMLGEANDFLIAKDLKSAGKIISHLSKMKTKTDSINGFIINFQKKASEILFAISKLPKVSDLNMYRLQRESAAMGNTTLDIKNLFSFKTELLTFYALPLSVMLGLEMKHAIAKNIVADSMTKILIAATIAYAIQYIINRKLDIYYKSWWKYTLHGVLGVIGGSMFVMGASSFMGYVWYSFLAGAFMYGTSTLFNKFINDNNKQFAHNTAEGFMENFETHFASEIDKIKESLPSGSFSYVDETSQTEYRKKARMLEETVKITADTEDLNFFKNQEKEAA